MNTKDVSATCCGTSVPSSDSTIRQVSNQLPIISYYFHGSSDCSRFYRWCHQTVETYK